MHYCGKDYRCIIISGYGGYCHPMRDILQDFVKDRTDKRQHISLILKKDVLFYVAASLADVFDHTL